MTRIGVRTAVGVYAVDLDEGIPALEPELQLPESPPVPVPLPRVRAAAASGSTVIALVERRPPLAVSHDAGRTWREAGRGLPEGRAVAIAPDDPDLLVFAARNRLWLSRDGGRFWSSLPLELPAIEAVAFLP